MNYRCMLEVFLNVDADSEEEAQRKASETLCAKLREGIWEFIVWEDEHDQG